MRWCRGEPHSASPLLLLMNNLTPRLDPPTPIDFLFLAEQMPGRSLNITITKTHLDTFKICCIQNCDWDAQK